MSSCDHNSTWNLAESEFSLLANIWSQSLHQNLVQRQRLGRFCRNTSDSRSGSENAASPCEEADEETPLFDVPFLTSKDC